MKNVQSGITKGASYLEHLYSDDCIIEFYDY